MVRRVLRIWLVNDEGKTIISKQAIQRFIHLILFVIIGPQTQADGSTIEKQLHYEPIPLSDQVIHKFKTIESTVQSRSIEYVTVAIRVTSRFSG